MCATKLLLLSGGITHPFFFQGLISFFLERGALFRATRSQCIRAQRRGPPIGEVTTLQSLPEAHYRRGQPDGLQNRRRPSFRKHAVLSFR